MPQPEAESESIVYLRRGISQVIELELPSSTAFLADTIRYRAFTDRTRSNKMLREIIKLYRLQSSSLRFVLILRDTLYDMLPIDHEDIIRVYGRKCPGGNISTILDVTVRKILQRRVFNGM